MSWWSSRSEVVGVVDGDCAGVGADGEQGVVVAVGVAVGDGPGDVVVTGRGHGSTCIVSARFEGRPTSVT